MIITRDGRDDPTAVSEIVRNDLDITNPPVKVKFERVGAG